MKPNNDEEYIDPENVEDYFVDSEDDSTADESGPVDEMDAMMDQYLDQMADSVQFGQLLNVPIVAVREDHVLVDVGDKAEGMVPLRELEEAGITDLKPGLELEVVARGHDSESGLMLLSFTEARRRKALKEIENAHKEQKVIKGKVVRAVKGGLIVDVGTTAFLPASQVDLRRVNDLESWVDKELDFVVIEFVPRKNRIVVSRRKLLEEAEGKRREEIFSKLTVGETIEGHVKRIVDFGVFIDLGGIDGLMPRSEISWNRTAKPEDYVSPGDPISLKIIEMDKDAGKITLSRRQMVEDPWRTAAELYPKDKMIEGAVVSITNYGAFVRLQEGLDGMIHISDMAWDSQGRQPKNLLSVGQVVKAQVLKVDPVEKRISLGLKQLESDPWDGLEDRHPPMTKITGKVTGLTKYGAFVEIEEGVEGMIHVSDFAWDKRVESPNDTVNKGDEIECCLLSVDRDQRRISLGVKQLTDSPIKQFSTAHKKGDVVEGEIVSMNEFGVFVKLDHDVEGFIHVSNLDVERVEKPSDSFNVGDKIEGEITKLDRKQGKVALSRKTILKKREKKEMAAYLEANDSGGQSLGELLSEIKLDDGKPKE